MLKSKKAILFAAGLSTLGIAATLFVYVSFRRSEKAHLLSARELLSALPSEAPTLIYLDLAAVRASGFYQHRPDKKPIAIPDRNYAAFVQSTGFDFEKDLDRVVVAAWPAASSKEQGKNVVVAEGRFDKTKIRDYALRKGKLDHQQGREVFLFTTDDRASSNSVTFLDDRHIAIVAGPSIAPIFGGRAGDPAVDPARERASRLDGAAAFAITRVPPIPANFAPGGVQFAELARLARSVQWITLAARPEGDNLRISLEGECDNGEDARQLQAALEVLRIFGRAALDSPKTKQSIDPATYSVLQTVLSNADVTESGERVRILLELTPDILILGETRKSQ